MSPAAAFFEAEKGDSHQIWASLTANDAWPG
jgi:hypothetical protein